MLDIKFICENTQKVKEICKVKKDSADIEKIVELDSERRRILAEVEELKHKRNDASAQIAAKKKKNEDASEIISQMQSVSTKIKELDEKVDFVVKERDEIMAKVPNIPHESVPHGESEKDNVAGKEWGEKPSFNFKPKDHLTIAENLKIFDFVRGAKISGSGFPVLRGNGARLNRALIDFFLDTHRKNGYTEIQPPYLVNAQSAFGTGQLPKSREQMYYVGEDDLYAIPTAEVPVTNLYRDEYIDEKDLPIKMCAYSACFRRFNKVEMVYFAHPEKSYENHEELVACGEKLLQELGLPHRVVSLCKGDLGFGAAKCYDLEVFAPVEKKWLEVSSVSNFEDYQARRANIRTKINGKNTFVHTLNGSGLATPRVMVAICELACYSRSFEVLYGRKG